MPDCQNCIKADVCKYVSRPPEHCASFVAKSVDATEHTSIFTSAEMITTYLDNNGVLQILLGDRILAEVSDGEDTVEFVEEILFGMGYEWNKDGTISVIK